MDQGNGNFKGATRELTLDRVACRPRLGHHNLLSIKASDYSFPRANAQRSSHRHRSPSTRSLDNRSLLPLTRDGSPRGQGPSTHRKWKDNGDDREVSGAARRLPPDTSWSSQRLVGHPGEEIKHGKARTAGVHLTGTWSPCAQCSEARVRRYTVSKSTGTGTLYCASKSSPVSSLSASRKATPRRNYGK